ncbi:MAG TPA: lipopolysaccharide transport periplasmic protein LptA [Burkholderiales bacterium]|jgi:lipopolysaccharide export system protein LptA|nr:lipopolysaccharide transport periplasmic protein LptA [Burkholderiales bacterium]
MKLRDRSSLARRAADTLIALWLAMAVVPSPALAERADRDKPVNLEADRVEIDDAKKEAVFHGNVTLTQGTLMIKADRIIVKQDAEGFQYGIAYGNQAYFRQKREGVDEYIEGFADRLEYNGKADKLEMFANAQLKRGADEVRGDYISYNATTEFFQVIGGGKTAATPGNPQGRVRATIQPRPRNPQPTAQEPLPLKPAEQVGGSR